MTYIFDTREKKNEHIKKYFDEHGLEYKVKKMDVADYQIEGKNNLVIDRKQNLDELACNLTNRNDKSRFWREIRRARENGTKVIILCEHSRNIKEIKDVANWTSKYSRISGRDLMNEIYRVHIAYGVEFIFCDKRHTAQKIVDLLGQQ